MCEWCTKHGAGRKWYMNARYYAAEVARELDTEEFLMEQLKNFQKTFLHYDVKLTHMLRMPLFGRLLGRHLERQSDSKKILDIYKEAGVHGQTIPLEDGITILQELAGDPILYDYCYCRWSHRGIKKRCCFEFGLYSEIVDRFSRYAPEKVRIDPEKAGLKYATQLQRVIWMNFIFHIFAEGVIMGLDPQAISLPLTQGHQISPVREGALYHSMLAE